MTAVPSVSVVMPVRDGAHFLAEAIESVLAQRPPPCEVIVVDDGSRDATRAIATAFGPPVRVIAGPGRGAAAARNVGVAAARGDLLAFLDHDDLWCPGRLALQASLLAVEPGCALALGATQRVCVREGAQDGARGGALVAMGPPWPEMSLGAILVRKAALDRVGPLDETKVLDEDVDWFLRAKEAGLRVRMHEEVVQLYRRHETNATNRRDDDRRELLGALRDSIERRRSRDGTVAALSAWRDGPGVTLAPDGVSVVVAVRNGARYLAAALDSIRAQTRPAAEIVVVDGGSTDATLEIAAAHGDARIVHQVGRGIADAYNVGIAAARAPLVAFLSHDDRWSPDKLASQVAWLAAHPDHLYVTGWARFELEPGHAVPRGFRTELLGAERPASIMETLLARREAFRIVGPFDTRLAVAEDVDWFSRARQLRVPSGEVPAAVVLKRIHDRNASTNAAVNTRALLQVLRDAARRHREVSP